MAKIHYALTNAKCLCYTVNEKHDVERKGKKMLSPNPRRFEAEAELKIRKGERKRDFDTYPEDTSNPSESKRLSRRVIVLIRLTVLLLIIVGVVILYHLIH
jgi:hypothetical protein